MALSTVSLTLALSTQELFEWTGAFRAHGLEIVSGEATSSADIALWRDEDAIVATERTRTLALRLSPSILACDAAVVAALLARVSALRVSERAALEAGMLAHDARSLLQAMLLGAGILATTTSAESQPIARELVEGCMRVAQQILAQLAGAPRAEPRALDVHGILRDLVPTLQALCGTRPLHVALAPSAQVVRVDASDLERALVNLVVNACEASPEDAQVTLTTRVVDAWVVISVDDRGRGMDDATRARALEPFFTTKPNGEGSGLGLTSVREAMERAGGHVRIHSTPGAGTRVELWLPTCSPD